MGTPDPLLLGKAPPPIPANHPRSPILAALLALLCPGLGHFYCGAVGPALAWSIAPHLALLAMMFLGAFNAPNLHLWLAAGMVLWILLRLTQLALAWKQASALARYTLRPTNHAGLYLAFFLGTSMFTSLLGAPFRAWVVEPFKMPSSSMEPSLSTGDQFFVIKLGPYATVHRGDVIVYRTPEGSLPFVGRVVALAGDTVEIRQGRFFINGVEQPIAPCSSPDFSFEELGAGRTLDCFTEGNHRILRFPHGSYISELDAQTIPVGQLFVVGDNRDNSIDSREFGPISTAAAIGRVAVVWLSWGPGLKLRTERIGLRP